MELTIVAVFILASLLILAVEENSAIYADTKQSYSGPKLPDTHVDKLDDGFLKFLHQKLNQHTEFLEKIKEMVEANENLSKKILETLSYDDNDTPENAETHENRRRTKKQEDDKDDKVVKSKKNTTPSLNNLSKACRECEMEKRAAKTSTTTTKPTTQEYEVDEFHWLNYAERK